MTLATPVYDAWSMGHTSPNNGETLIQCLAGSVIIGFGGVEPADANDGVQLHANPSADGLGMQHITIPAGQTMYWRSAVPKKPCLIFYQDWVTPGP